MDGIELLEQLKTRAPELPIIVVSGHGTIETAVRATKLGASDFLEKPFSLDTLLRSVRRAIHQETSASADMAAPPSASLFALPRYGVTRRVPARTISQSVVVQGQGLHSGARTGVILQPLPPGAAFFSILCLRISRFLLQLIMLNLLGTPLACVEREWSPRRLSTSCRRCMAMASQIYW